MSDLITVQGVVLQAANVGEYDRRIVLLTRERGKIAAFAKGARRMNSPFMAAASPFVFGSFTLYEGRSSYNLNHAEIRHHFVELAERQPGIYYGFYFMELADYFGREGNDEAELMNLLYVSLRALLNPELNDRLVRCIFEFRLMVIEGLMPGIFECQSCRKKLTGEDRLYFSMSEHGVFCGGGREEPTDAERAEAPGGKPGAGRHPLPGDAFRISYAALYTLRFIAETPLPKLYGFTVKEELLRELEGLIHTYLFRNTEKRFKSLEILEMMKESPDPEPYGIKT